MGSESEHTGNTRRLERKVDELTRLTKQNNRMLRTERNARRIKTILITGVLLFGSGYAYYIFQTYQLQILEFQSKVENLRTQAEEVIDLGNELKESVESTRESVRTIFSSEQ